jgi:hypothetical protein
VPKLSINLEEFLSSAHGNFEEQNKALELSIIIINYYIIIIIIAHYNYTTNAYYNWYISNIDLIEECDQEENLEVTEIATTTTTCCLKRKL